MTGSEVTAVRAKRAVADALDAATPTAATPIDAGTNTLYRVATAESDYAVKFNTFVGREITAAEVAVYRLLADADVPVPRVVDAVLDPPSGPAYFVMTALPGDSPAEVSPELARRLGRVLRGFSSVAADIDGYGRLQHAPGATPPVTGSADTWRAYVDWYVEMLLSKPGDRVADLADPVRGVVDRALDAVPRRPDPAVVPDDYRPANVHVADGEIVGVLDLERAARGDLRLALVKSGYLLGRERPTGESARLRDALYAGYGADVPGEVERCYRAVAVASEIRGFDVWWDDAVTEERAAEVRTAVGELTDS
jgi:Ser/Thr protein kinase RdoA (MazF antagonist)